MNTRDAMCEVNGGKLFIKLSQSYYRNKKIPTNRQVNSEVQTDITNQQEDSSTSFFTKLTSKLRKSSSTKTNLIEDCDKCFQFLEAIPYKTNNHMEPEVISWIKAKTLPDVSLLIAVAMHEKLDKCMLKSYLKKKDMDLNKYYKKTINPVTKLYEVDNNYIVVINRQNKTLCSDLVDLIRTFTSSLHLRKPLTFQIALDVSCNVDRLDKAINFISNISSSNVKWILNIPFNDSVKYKRQLSSRWIVDIPLPQVTNCTDQSKTEALPSPPTYYSEEEEDHYYRNSIREILHFMKFSNIFTSDRLSKLYKKFIGTLPFSASSLSSIKVFVYDNHNKSFIEEPVSDYQWGFDGETLVQFDSEKNCYITSNKYVFCSSATEIMLDQKMFQRINELSLPLDKKKPEIISIQGVPGCGKSTWILNSHVIGKDLVLSSTKHGINEFNNKIASQCKDAGKTYEDIKTNYRTIASYLLNGSKKYDTVYIDEYIMVHAGLLGLVALLSECRKMFILGDQNQIPYIDRLHYVNMLYFDANKYITSSKHLNITYRCPADVVHALQSIYHQFCTTNINTKSVSFNKCQSINDIPVMPNTLYLTFTKSDKWHLNSQLKLPDSSKILTIHEAQGLTSASVICVRLSNRKMQLFDSLPHAIVALTRHTKKFIYYSPIEGDQLYSFIRTALSASKQNLSHVTVKSGTSATNKENSNRNKEKLTYKNAAPITKTKKCMNQTFYFQNVNKMSSKAAQFHNFVLKTLFPVYIICETSFYKEILSSEFFPSQYVVYRCDRSSQTSKKKTGGGVLIAVDTSLTNELVEISNLSIEQLCVKLVINKKTIYIYVVYLPPGSPISSYTACCDSIIEINNAADPSDVILIMGDFNFPTITWTYDEEMDEILPLNVGSETELLLIDTVLDTNLTQICDIKNGRDRILDLMFTNEPAFFKINESPSPFVINDINHKAIEIILESHGNIDTDSHQNRRPYYNFRKADTLNLQLYLEQINWENELISKNIDVNVENFYKTLFKGIESFVPTAVSKPNKYPPWYDDKLINLKNKKDKAYKETLKFYSESSKHKFTECNQNFESYFELKYKNYISSIKERIRKDPKHFWSFFKTKREINGYPACMTFNGQKSSDPQIISNMFAEFFQSVYKPEDINNYENPNNGESSLSIHTPNIEAEDIHRALETFGEGCGPDGIPASLLKDFRNLAVPLCLLFNQSLKSAVFPQRWKITRVTPIFKTGARNDVSCYRGITSISSIPKLFELVVCNSFRTVVPRYISQYQHGFMPKRSTSTNLIEFTSNSIKEIEKRKQVDVVYTDFAKAFDSISHCKTLERLYIFGFTNQFVAWFKSYLSNRIQYIEIGNKRSKVIQATSGVPQGSHVGPWIFIIFINGITEVIRHSKLLMFADDLKIFRTVETIDDTNKLQEDIDNLAIWCESYLLSLNINKCKTLSFHRKATPVIQQYQINGILLQKVFEIKDLGVTFVENMCFTKHIELCVARANSMLGFIKRWTGDIYDLETIKILYHAYVRSQLEYAVTVWCPFYDENIRNIENVQKKFVHYITWKDGWVYDQDLPYHLNLKQLPPYLTGCKTYNMTTLQNRRELLKCSFVGNILLEQIDAPSLLESIKINAPSRNLRDHEFLHLDIHRTNYGDNEPMNMMSKSFNNIDHLFDFSINKDSFRRRLKQHYAPS